MSLVVSSFSCYNMLLGILTSVLGTCFSTSQLLVWSFLVIGSLSVCGWLKAFLSSDALVLYFVVSVLGGLLFLISSIESILSSLVLQLALLLKLGIAPFQFWVFKVLSQLELGQLCFFLGPSKVGFLWLLVNISFPSYILASLSLFLGLSLLWLSYKLQLVLYASGACQLLILLLLGPSSFAPYYFIYTTALFGVFCIQLSVVSGLVAFLCLGALPPLTMFWAKVIAIFLLPFFSSVLVLLISLLCLYPYIRTAIFLSSPTQTSFLPLASLILLPFLVFSLFS